MTKLHIEENFIINKLVYEDSNGDYQLVAMDSQGRVLIAPPEPCRCKELEAALKIAVDGLEEITVIVDYMASSTARKTVDKIKETLEKE